MAPTPVDVARSREIAETLLSYLVETVEAEQIYRGREAGVQIVEFVLEDLIAGIVLTALSSAEADKSATSEQKLKRTALNLNEAKHMISESVSEGFTKAYLEWCGQLTEHHTQIRMLDHGVLDTGTPS